MTVTLCSPPLLHALLQNAPHFFQYRPKHPAVVKINMEAVPVSFPALDPCLALLQFLDRKVAGKFGKDLGHPAPKSLAAPASE